jgi:light-regulated signal transduction histidine kinase (bacteriophytochrome)
MDLAEARRALEQANLHLEDLVEQRTRALSEANRELKRSNEDLEAFAYIASHHLQEPLRKIELFGDRLKAVLGGRIDATAADYLERMLGASSRLQALIADLLAYSRVSAIGEDGSPVDIAPLIREIWSDLEVRAGENRAGLELESLPVLRADALQLRLLFQNLLCNALKFSRPDVPARIRIDAQPRADGGVRIRVEDNGIGFDNRYAERIFQIFERLHGNAYGGTGVGLALCRKIAERLGGGMRAEGREGEGATFMIDLSRACLADPGTIAAATEGSA